MTIFRVGIPILIIQVTQRIFMDKHKSMSNEEGHDH